MKENLYYLFVSGIFLASGPCLGVCAPILLSYVAAHRTTLKKSLLSYGIFSACKLISYMTLGALCGLGVRITHNPETAEYLSIIYPILGIFIVLIGLSTIISPGGGLKKVCGWLHQGNIRNVGILGFIIGFSPCLPLLGILNYIVIISDTPLQAVLFSLVFGLGTVISPLVILIMLSAKVAGWFSAKKKLQTGIRITCGLILLFLGGRIILQTLLQ